MHSRKSLLLSDGSQIFSALHGVFTEAGYQTATADSSRGAMQALGRGDFHLLIARISERRREPLGLLRSLRRRYPKVTAIILRGEHEINSPLEAYQMQNEEEVFIPCGWAGLKRLVANCLSR